MAQFFIQCPDCKISSRKTESGDFERPRQQNIEPEATVVWRQCPACQQRAEVGLPVKAA